MAKRYQSQPHKIDAFRFTKKQRELPGWFIEAMEQGKASITINGETRYISIYGKDQEEKAYHLEWICRSDHGKIYKLDDETFQEYYKPVI